MEKIQFDSGVRSYRINGGGILRFNPSDPNLYSRFLEAVEKLQEAEKELTRQAETAQAQDIVKLMTQADEKMKNILGCFRREQRFPQASGRRESAGSGGQR